MEAYISILTTAYHGIISLLIQPPDTAPNNIVSVEKSVLTTHGGRGGRRVQLVQDTFLHPPEDALLLLLLLLASWGVVTLGSCWHHWLLRHHGHHLARVQVTLHLRIHLTWQGKRLWLAWTGKTQTKTKNSVCVCSDKLKWLSLETKNIDRFQLYLLQNKTYA